MFYVGIIGKFAERFSTKRLEAYFENKALKFDIHLLPGIKLFIIKKTSSSDHDIILKNTNSILMGRPFDKDTYTPIADLKKTSNLSNKEIFDKVWGKIVYIQSNDREISILRDPTGQLDCFYKREQGVFLFSSSIELLSKLSQEKPSYDWEYMTSYVHRGWMNTTSTPFKNYSELPGGNVVNIKLDSNEIDLKTVWHPSYDAKNFNDFENKIIPTIKNTLKSWIAPYDEIFLDLSGGVDSTSLLYILKDIIGSKKELKAINFYHSKISSSDELYYAKDACDDLMVPLIRHNMAECLPFSTYKQLPFAPSKPSSALTHINSEQKLKTYVEKENHIFISGHGGDHIFSCPPSISVGADSFLEEGLFRSIKIMNELSDYFRMPIYKIYGENIFRLFKYVLKIKGKTIQDAHLKKRSIDWKTKKFNDLIKNSNKLSVFKNLDKLDYIPGKLDDLEGIYSLFSMMDICVRDFQNPIFYPLSYTPIVEIAFGIPTYKMFQKGYDRFPLRKEVYKKYNTNNMWRRDKGETTGIMQLGFKSNLKEIKELCIEGNFSRNGLIDKDLLLNEIESYAAGESLNMWPVIQILSAEIFMKYW